MYNNEKYFLDFLHKEKLLSFYFIMSFRFNNNLYLTKIIFNIKKYIFFLLGLLCKS